MVETTNKQHTSFRNLPQVYLNFVEACLYLFSGFFMILLKSFFER